MESATRQQSGDPGQAGVERGGSATRASAQVLRRWIEQQGKTRTPAGPPAQQVPEFRLERAAATALARAAEKQQRLPVFVEKVELADMTLAELPELLPERALLAVVEGRRDALGVVAICPNLLAALIEMQAIGRVTSRPAQPRKPTRTDAVISADFVNALLAELGRECATRNDCPDFPAFCYATYMDDPRPLALMLEDGKMTRLSLHFRIGAGGQRDGHLMIALPAEITPCVELTQPGKGNPPPLPAIQPVPAMHPPTATSLAEEVQQAPIQLLGILCRRRLSLHHLRNLTPGSLLPLPQNVLDDARVETARGQILAHGRLGEKDGFHAVRLRNIGQGAVPDETTELPCARQKDSVGASPDKESSSLEPKLPLADIDRPDAFRATKAAAAATTG